MALNTSITRNGEALTLRWNMWHVQCMLVAKCRDDGLPEAFLLDQLDQLDDLLDEAKTQVKTSAPDLYLVDKFDEMADSIGRMARRCNDKMWEHVTTVGMMDGHELKNDYRFELKMTPEEEQHWSARNNNLYAQVLELKAGDVLWMNIAPRQEEVRA